MSTAILILATFLTFVVMISLLVAAHELGHYLFARLFGMGAEEFAIGMGRPLGTWMRRTYVLPLPADSPLQVGEVVHAHSDAGKLEGGARTVTGEVVATPTGKGLRETTDFTLRLWPVGGFVRIKGMSPEEDGSEVRVPGGFYSKAPWKRIVVLFAGPAFSVITGVLILAAGYMVKGVPRDSLLVENIVVGSPADRAGIRRGDRLTSIDGRPVARYYDLVREVGPRSGQRLVLGLEREGARLTTPITPELSQSPVTLVDPDGMPTGEMRRLGRIGVVPTRKLVAVGAGDALREAWLAPVKVVQMLGRSTTEPARLKENVGGPISIVRAIGSAVEAGPAAVVAITAFLSISVGIFNLLPIFPLDGGQILVAVIEMLRGGRRPSYRFQYAMGMVGFFLVMGLALAATLLDVGRIRKDVTTPAPVVPKTKYPTAP